MGPLLWKGSALPDLSGQVAIVTGGNAGIGYHTALGLGKKNCRVIIASRSVAKGTLAVEKLRKETGNEFYEFIQLDLSSFASVEKFAGAFLKKKLPLNMLICNAGVAYLPYSLTEDKITTTLQTNYLGHVLLEQLLEHKLIESATIDNPSRIVNVTSELARLGKIIWKHWDADFSELGYTPASAYAESKVAQCIWSYKLASELESKGVLVNVVHPGYARTEIQTKMDKSDFRANALRLWITYFGQSSKAGAISSLYAAASTQVVKGRKTGKLYGPDVFNFFNHWQRGRFGAQFISDRFKLWEKTYELIKSRTGIGRGDVYQKKEMESLHSSVMIDGKQVSTLKVEPEDRDRGLSFF